MDRPSIEERLRRIAETVAEKCGFELVNAEKLGAGKALTVRVFIDKPGGISHDDCSVYSREIGVLLESEDIFPSSYVLEVSSPGLERELYSLRDFGKYAGCLARLKTRNAIDGQKVFRGRIEGIEGETIRFNDKRRGIVCFRFEEIARANLEIDLDEELRRAG